jgi:hypothetical protein
MAVVLFFGLTGFQGMTPGQDQESEHHRSKACLSPRPAISIAAP